MSDTPRTEAFANAPREGNVIHDVHYFALLNHARQLERELAQRPEATTYIEVTTAMEEAGMKEAKHQYNLPVTRASVYAIFNAMLQASPSMNIGGDSK